jgi:membrane protein implicated in regulation of membrane protease activity
VVALYIAAFLVGIAILIFGIVLGNFDHSIETHDSGEGDGHVWIPFLSPRFWIYGLGSFGLAGILLTLAHVTNTLTLSVITGVVTGVLISYITKFVLRKAETSSDYRMEKLLGQIGSVTVPIRAGIKGKIRLNRHDEVLEVFAIASNPNLELMPGESVIVVGVDGDTLEVIPQDDLLN